MSDGLKVVHHLQTGSRACQGLAPRLQPSGAHTSRASHRFSLQASVTSPLLLSAVFSISLISIRLAGDIKFGIAKRPHTAVSLLPPVYLRGGLRHSMRSASQSLSVRALSGGCLMACEKWPPVTVTSLNITFFERSVWENPEQMVL